MPHTIIIAEGFSGYLDNDNKCRGTCAKCVHQYCRQYQRDELHSNRFFTFPKNPSPRVCPVDAIKIDSDGNANINENICISCGLCIHRCPYAAIQYSVKQRKCWINHNPELLAYCSHEETLEQIEKLWKVTKKVIFDKLTKSFADSYSMSLRIAVSSVKDLSEIVVRNTLINLGCKCNVNAPGNNHNRIEFFAETGDKFIIGESEITNSDTLSVSRRILDDMAVLISRHGFTSEKIIPLAVINGLPNKRTDYYEVIEDIEKVIGIKVSTITYHILYLLNLYNIKINSETISSFYLTREHDSLLEAMRKIIPQISILDSNVYGIYYTPIK